MTAPAAISGSFADYRLVKSRSVLQLVIEIPVEGQRNAFDALGYPMPGVEIPVAIARLTEPASAPARERPAADTATPQAGGGANSISAKERYASLSPGEQAVQRAGILAGDPRFQAWAEDQLAPTRPGIGLSEEAAADFIRERCCFGGPRKLIAQEPEALDKYIALETAFKIAVGEIAEPR